MRRLLPVIPLLMWCIVLRAGPAKGRAGADSALAHINSEIEYQLKMGDTEKEGNARWQKIVTLKNFSMTKEQANEAAAQMEWFSKHGQWDNYYRAWQLKANAYSALGKLQTALQETQRMLSDAQERDNRLGRAMGYKQIGIIYLNMKQTEPAIDALRHYAELMKDEEDDISSLSSIYYRMAKAYDYDQAYDRELAVTGEWLAFIRDKAEAGTKSYHEMTNSCYLARAAAYTGLGRFDDAGAALDTAAIHARQNNTSLTLHHYYKMQARYRLARGDAAEALRYTDSVRMVTSEKDDHTSEVRAKALMALGQGQEAAAIYQRLYQEKDSVFGREARQHLDELNTLFQVDEMKTEQQRTKLRYMLMAGGSVVLALLLLLFYGWRSALRQKRANELLRVANERAKVSSKMKSEFIRNITHEIRTPLNILSGFTQILTDPAMEIPKEEKADIQERIAENADRITKLVDRMLELSDASSEAVIERNDQTNVAELVGQAIDHSRIIHHTRPANPDSAVSFEYPGSEAAALVTLRTNRLYAVRMLAQLLENAAKFTHEGTITLHVAHTDSQVSFIVEDTGIGVPPEHSEHIFEEFVQLDSFADGTGIGLTVARSIAQRMGGDLWLDAGYRRGARFVLELRKN